MEKLYDTLGESEVKDLLATGEKSAVAVSLEPGNGVIPYGAVLYRKSGVLYAPAAAANIAETSELLVLAADADTTTSETVAIAVKAYEKGVFKAGKVRIKSGNDYVAVTAAQALILRKQGITFRPFDDWREDDVVADNTVEATQEAGSGDGQSSGDGGAL